jgi:hypothetical protein
MFRFLKSTLVTALAAAVAVQAYSEPGACSGYCWAHDPAVIQRASDGTYFKFNTGTGIQYATASSLAGPWTIQGYVLPNGSSINNAGSKDPWVGISSISDCTTCLQNGIGARCASCEWCILSLLRSFNFRFPEQCNWCCHQYHDESGNLVSLFFPCPVERFSHHDTRFSVFNRREFNTNSLQDRPRVNWSVKLILKIIQCDRPQLDHGWKHPLSQFRLFLG